VSAGWYVDRKNLEIEEEEPWRVRSFVRSYASGTLVDRRGKSRQLTLILTRMQCSAAHISSKSSP
jgi:hypothetical protein